MKVNVKDEAQLCIIDTLKVCVAPLVSNRISNCYK